MKALAFRKPKFKHTWPFHIMLLPGLVILLIFHYIPMVGIVIAFQDFQPPLGFFKSPWVGWDNFQYMVQLPDTLLVVKNTLIIALLKIGFGLVVPVTFAILLNEVRRTFLKKSIQTLVYFPHFLSWVILGGILTDILALRGGAVNHILGWFAIKPIFFLGDPSWFRTVIVTSDIWKEFGFSAIVYLAALTGINPALYEAARMDGANRWKQTLHITLPGIMPIVVLMATLALGNILNAGFDQIFNLYNVLVYSTGDIIDTYVYRAGLLNAQYGLATAVGLFKSVVGLFLIATSYWLATKYANYRIF